MDTSKYPLFYSAFGDCINLIATKPNREEYKLWDIVSKGYEDRWERALPEIMSILALPDIKSFITAFGLIPEDVAGDVGRFDDFTAEVIVAQHLQEVGFIQIRKLQQKMKSPNPDYLAYVLTSPFAVEVIHLRKNEMEEARAIDHRVFDLTALLRILTKKFEMRLPKLERQLAVYPQHKKMAAVTYSWEAPAAFMHKEDAGFIANSLLRIANGKIDHVLIESTLLRGGDFIIPEIQREIYVPGV